VLDGDVMSNHSTPEIGSRFPWTPKHLPRTSVPATFLPCLHRFSAFRIGFGRRLQYLSGLLSLPAPDGRCATFISLMTALERLRATIAQPSAPVTYWC
jgi:hypothetical protein